MELKAALSNNQLQTMEQKEKPWIYSYMEFLTKTEKSKKEEPCIHSYREFLNHNRKLKNVQKTNRKNINQCGQEPN